MDVAWNPFNENIVASCSEDCMVKIWEIPDEGLKENWGGDKALIELSGHNRKCGHIHWHPTAENILASSGFDNIIIIWNVEIGKEMLRVFIVIVLLCVHVVFYRSVVTLTQSTRLTGTLMAALLQLPAKTRRFE